jgi:hypothetical protein
MLFTLQILFRSLMAWLRHAHTCDVGLRRGRVREAFLRKGFSCKSSKIVLGFKFGVFRYKLGSSMHVSANHGPSNICFAVARRFLGKNNLFFA